MPTHSKKLDYITRQIGKNENEDGYQITPRTISVRNDSGLSQL